MFQVKKQILSGEYLKKRKRRTPSAAAAAESVPCIPSEVDSRPEVVTFAKPTKPVQKQPIPSTPPPVSSRQPAAPAALEPAHNADEDAAIQDILDDIRGSFERQFDRDFEELTTSDETGGGGDDGGGGRIPGDVRQVGGVEHDRPVAAAVVAELPFAMDQPFPMGLDNIQPLQQQAPPPQQLQQQQQFPPQPLFPPQQQLDEIPSIVSAFSVDDDASGDGGNFLNAGTISQEEWRGLDNLFAGQQMPGDASVPDLGQAQQDLFLTQQPQRFVGNQPFGSQSQVQQQQYSNFNFDQNL